MSRRAEGGAAALAGARILAVEDEYLVLLEVATVLTNAGAVVTKCTTIEQALQKIDAEPFAAAVLDMRIGRATIAPVVHKLADLGTPFVFYTGQVQSEPAVSQWPRARTVSKPAAPRVLVNAIAELINGAESRARDR